MKVAKTFGNQLMAVILVALIVISSFAMFVFIDKASSSIVPTPMFWKYDDIKTLDPWGDSYNDATDIVAAYVKQVGQIVGFRVDLLDVRNDSNLNLYFAIDYKDGGNNQLTDHNASFVSDTSWDLLLVAYNSSNRAIYNTQFVNHPEYFNSSSYETELDYFEFSIFASALAGWDNRPLKFQVLTTNNNSDVVVDKTSEASTNNVTGRAKLVVPAGNIFMANSPNSISWYDGYDVDGTRRLGERRGTKYLLDAAEKYEVPLTILDLRTDLLPGMDYLQINDRLIDLADKGLLDPMGSLSYGHFLPWQPDDVDTLAIQYLREYRARFNLPVSQVFAPYEGMLKAGDLQAIKNGGYSAIFTDQYAKWFGWISDWSNATEVHEKVESTKKIHQVNGLTVFFDPRINYGFAWDPRWGQPQFPSDYEMYTGTDHGLHLWTRRILLDMAGDVDQQKFMLFGTGHDLQLTPMFFGDVAEWNFRWLAAHPWIELTTFSGLLQKNWTPINHGTLNIPADQPMERYTTEGDLHYNAYFWQFYYGGVSDGHSPLIPQGTVIEGYFDYVPYLRDGQKIPSGMKMGDDKTPGTIVYATLHNLRNAPQNDLTDLAWQSYFVDISEQTLHAKTLYRGGEADQGDFGGQYLYPSSKVKANYMGQINKIVAASNWANEVETGSQAISVQVIKQDLDLDGEDEFVLKNNKVFAIFENDGGKIEYAFAYDPSKGPIQLVAPVYQQNGFFGPLSNYEDGETALRPTLQLTPVFWDASFTESGYEYSLFDGSINGNNLSFVSSDGKIRKTFTLSDYTISAQYSTSNLDEVKVGFGLPANMANVFSRDWSQNIVKVDIGGRKGWNVLGGGYAGVNLIGTSLHAINSFTDSPAREELKQREDPDQYPDGHFFYFPYNTVTVTGRGTFDVSLSFSETSPIPTPTPSPTSNPTSQPSPTVESTPTPTQSSPSPTVQSTPTPTQSSPSPTSNPTTTTVAPTPQSSPTPTVPELTSVYVIAIVVVVTGLSLVVKRAKTVGSINPKP